MMWCESRVGSYDNAAELAQGVETEMETKTETSEQGGRKGRDHMNGMGIECTVLASQSKRLKLNYTMTNENHFFFFVGFWARSGYVSIVQRRAAFPSSQLPVASSLRVTYSIHKSIIAVIVCALCRPVRPAPHLWPLCVTHNYAVIDIFYDVPPDTPLLAPSPSTPSPSPLSYCRSSRFWASLVFKRNQNL